MDDETLADRLCAVERALTDEDASPAGPDAGKRLDDLAAQVRELEARTQALQGYVESLEGANPERQGNRSTGQSWQRGGAQGYGDGMVTPGQGGGRRSSRDESPDEESLLDRMASWL